MEIPGIPQRVFLFNGDDYDRTPFKFTKNRDIESNAAIKGGETVELRIYNREKREIGLAATSAENTVVAKPWSDDNGPTILFFSLDVVKEGYIN
jgi:hypothetical protein